MNRPPGWTEGRKGLLKLIRKLREDLGMGVVMVSHRLQDIMSTCDRVVVLEGGDSKTGTPRRSCAVDRN